MGISAAAAITAIVPHIPRTALYAAAAAISPIILGIRAYAVTAFVSRHVALLPLDIPLHRTRKITKAVDFTTRVFAITIAAAMVAFFTGFLNAVAADGRYDARTAAAGAPCSTRSPVSAA